MGIALGKTSIDLGIVTTNGEAMLAFYRDVIGLKVQGQMAMPGGGTMHRLLSGESLIKLVVVPHTPASATRTASSGSQRSRPEHCSSRSSCSSWIFASSCLPAYEHNRARAKRQ